MAGIVPALFQNCFKIGAAFAILPGRDRSAQIQVWMAGEGGKGEERRELNW